RLGPLLLKARRRGAAVVAADVPASDTVATWLTTHGQSPALREWLWNPLAVAALNQDPAIASASPFVRVLGELFGPRHDDASVGLASVPLDELYALPAQRFIEARGGAVLLKSPGRVRVENNRVLHVLAGSTTIETSRVIAAVPWHAFSRIWDGDV